MSSKKDILARLDEEIDKCHNPAAIILGREESQQLNLTERAEYIHKYNDISVIQLTSVKNKLLCVEGDRLYTLKVTEDTLRDLARGEANQYAVAAARNQLRTPAQERQCTQT